MAKKVENFQKYWQEIAAKAGIDQDQADAIAAALGNEATAQAFRQAFVATPEYHSAIDSIKSEQAAYQAQVEDWYNKTAAPAYNQSVEAMEKLRQYETVYGPLDADGDYSREDAMNLGFNSKKELDAYLDERLRAERAGYVGLIKSVPNLAIKHFKNFNEELNLDELEKISVQNGISPEMAYDKMIADRVEERRKAEFEAAVKQAREEGRKEALSANNIPLDSTPRESSPFFDRTEVAASKSDLDADRESRAAFFEGWNNHESKLKAS